MSRERARRRAEQQEKQDRQARSDENRAKDRAEQDRRRDQRKAANRQRRQARRDRAKASTGRRRFSRRTREQRIGTWLLVVAVIALSFLLTDSWPVRVAVAAITVLAIPMVSTAVLDRSSR